MKKIIIFLLFSIFIFNSCKKDSNNPVNTNTVPSAPTLLSPTNTASDVAIIPTFSWNASNGAVSYTLQVSLSSSFTNFIYNQNGITGTSQQVTVFNPFTIYYWRVSATNNYGTSDWSAVRSFITTGPLPKIPILSSPLNGSPNVPVLPTLRWNTSSGANSYTLQVSADSSFTSFVYNQSGLVGTSRLIGGLSIGIQYYWRVNATNSYGTSGWSNTWSFTSTAALGTVYITSIPAGAQIWLDGTNSGKVTPDTVANITLGNHTFTLKLTGYNNDTSIVNVVAGTQTLSKILSSNKSVTSYGPIQIWESADPSAIDPAGIVLKNGQAISIGAGTFGPVDIYYESTGFVVQSAQSLHNNTGRSTLFFVGLNDTLTDGVASPLATSSWATKVTDTQGKAKYFFLFDQDSHYSKMIITELHNASMGDPGWIKVKWLYNNKPNDTRF